MDPRSGGLVPRLQYDTRFTVDVHGVSVPPQRKMIFRFRISCTARTGATRLLCCCVLPNRTIGSGWIHKNRERQCDFCSSISERGATLKILTWRCAPSQMKLLQDQKGAIYDASKMRHIQVPF